MVLRASATAVNLCDPAGWWQEFGVQDKACNMLLSKRVKGHKIFPGATKEWQVPWKHCSLQQSSWSLTTILSNKLVYFKQSEHAAITHSTTPMPHTLQSTAQDTCRNKIFLLTCVQQRLKEQRPEKKQERMLFKQSVNENCPLHNCSQAHNC